MGASSEFSALLGIRRQSRHGIEDGTGGATLLSDLLPSLLQVGPLIYQFLLSDLLSSLRQVSKRALRLDRIATPSGLGIVFSGYIIFRLILKEARGPLVNFQWAGTQI